MSLDVRTSDGAQVWSRTGLRRVRFRVSPGEAPVDPARIISTSPDGWLEIDIEFGPDASHVDLILNPEEEVPAVPEQKITEPSVAETRPEPVFDPFAPRVEASAPDAPRKPAARAAPVKKAAARKASAKKAAAKKRQ